jgi:hypothetical protein
VEQAFIPFIKVVFDPDVDPDEAESSVYFNGVSVGQWSEPYNSISTGISSASLVALPNSVSSLIDFPGELKYANMLDPYGFNNDLDSGYVDSFK